MSNPIKSSKYFYSTTCSKEIQQVAKLCKNIGFTDYPNVRFYGAPYTGIEVDFVERRYRIYHFRKVFHTFKVSFLGLILRLERIVDEQSHP